MSDRHYMEIDPDKPGWWALLHGAGDLLTRIVAWVGTLTLAFLITFAIIAVAH